MLLMPNLKHGVAYLNVTFESKGMLLFREIVHGGVATIGQVLHALQVPG
jgi:hypothetical protein